MSKSKDREYFSRLNYNAILKKVNDNYYLFISELSLVAEGKSVNEAYENLDKMKRSYFTKMIDIGAEDTIREPVTVQFRKKIFTDLLMFFIKASIVTFLVIILSLPLVMIIDQLPMRTVNRCINIPKAVNYKIKNMSQDEKEKMRMKLRDAMQNMKPFVDEIKVLWEDKNQQ